MFSVMATKRTLFSSKYKTLFENKAKYDAIMSVLADMLFDEAAKQKAVD